MRTRTVTAEERSRAFRLYDPNDPRSVSVVAKRLGFSRRVVREILFGTVAPSDPTAAAKRSTKCLEKARSQRSEREAHWTACKPEAERLLLAGRDVVAVSVELGVSVMRLKSLKKSLGQTVASKSCA